MTVRRILNYPDPRLKTVAKIVEDINEPRVQEMISDMLETLEKTEHCGGLASTQLDIKDPYRIFVFCDFDESDSNSKYVVTEIINPEIIATEGEVFEEEGCMSVYPDHVHASITRPAQTTMRGINKKGDPVEYTRRGYLAKNFMHEVDHLNGIIYIDHLKSLKRKMLDKKILKLRKRMAE